MSGLRIIGGDLGGRRIRVPRGSDVRPTADRVREALFSILGERTREARVLDLYSGSGALGLEAISRGARTAVFCEFRAEALRALRSNVSALEVADRCRLLPGRVLETLRQKRAGGPFDLVLADPPYSAGEAGPLLRQIAGSDLLSADGLIVVERDRASDVEEVEGLVRFRTARYGRTCVDFYRIGGAEGNRASG